MDKEILGSFIAKRRKELALTQRDLADRLRITDKAVSKWERGLSYPDVTLLEPLANELELGVEELVSGRRQEERGAAVGNLLKISNDSIKREKRHSSVRLWILAALLTAAAAIAVLYASVMVTDQRVSTVVLTETVGEKSYLYVEEQGHLLQLAYDREIRVVPIGARKYGDHFYKLTCRWNRKTLKGTVIRCEDLNQTTPNRAWNEISGFQLSDSIFGFPVTWYNCEETVPDPAGDGYLGSYSFSAWTECNSEGGPLPRTILEIYSCRAFAPMDYDGDGIFELVVQTRWPEKPYAVYDQDENGKITSSWPETVSTEVLEQLNGFGAVNPA